VIFRTASLSSTIRMDFGIGSGQRWGPGVMVPANPNLQGFVCSILYSGYRRHPPSDGRSYFGFGFHEVKVMDFTKRLDRTGGSLREVIHRQRIRSILGIPISR
jgi:hypothetical protein